MAKLFTVIGARPQFVKASAVSKVIVKSKNLQEVVCHTGQHFSLEMSEVNFADLDMLKPKYNLGINRLSHGEMTGAMLIEIEKLMIEERPDLVLLYGDTNSTLAGALAASKLNIPIAHIEAGLRSFNMSMPEEVNRVITDRVSKLLFAPTKLAVKNLLQEGVEENNISLVGDVMLDVARSYTGISEKKSQIRENLNIKKSDYILLTIHRSENTDKIEKLQNIYEAILELSRSHLIIWPMHPRTRERISAAGITLPGDSNLLRITEPIGYLDMVDLEKNASLIVTDSGGVQKEAYFHKVPCITLRCETEWVELLDTHWNRLVPPTSSASIITGITNAIGTKGDDVQLYGDGFAADHIVEVLQKKFT